MLPENLNMEEITEARRNAIAATIKPISTEQLKELGTELFPYLDHPWRERFFEFIAENSDATFHHATTHDHVHIVYCNARDRGIWYLPGGGMGPLQPKGLKILKEIVEAAR